MEEEGEEAEQHQQEDSFNGGEGQGGNGACPATTTDNFASCSDGQSNSGQLLQKSFSAMPLPFAKQVAHSFAFRRRPTATTTTTTAAAAAATGNHTTVILGFARNLPPLRLRSEDGKGEEDNERAPPPPAAAAGGGSHNAPTAPAAFATNPNPAEPAMRWGGARPSSPSPSLRQQLFLSRGRTLQTRVLRRSLSADSGLREEAEAALASASPTLATTAASTVRMEKFTELVRQQCPSHQEKEFSGWLLKRAQVRKVC